MYVITAAHLCEHLYITINDKALIKLGLGTFWGRAEGLLSLPIIPNTEREFLVAKAYPGIVKDLSLCLPLPGDDSVESRRGYR